jgi:Kef-type K+ transport system membrane component KefB
MDPVALGFLLGPAALNVIDPQTNAGFTCIATFALAMVGFVAIDDAWSLILFSIALLVLQGTDGDSMELGLILTGLAELAGAALPGLLLGIPMALLSGRVRKGQPTLLEVLGMVMICAGIAQWLSLSYLLACVTLGATVANLAKHHRLPFTTIEEIDWPFLALFFIFSGAYLGVEAILAGGWLCLGYVLFRFLGRIAAGYIAALPAWIDTSLSRWMGAAMMPQGGIALAMAFLAARAYPEYAQQITAIIITAIFIFELLGPIASRYTLSVNSSE